MFTSLKKWVKNDENYEKGGPPPGLHTMRSDLQKKFAKGVQYNLKILLRGDRNVGKTCLWHRLQGHKFLEEYVPTPEIQATSIHWNYKATDDIVKVDVWDVVDKGKKKKSEDDLKLVHQKEDDEEQKLDASFLDVYKSAHAVIIMFDITKKWTFQYVEKELPRVPSHLPVLILANHRDMGSHRVVKLDEVQALAEGVDRPPGSAGVMCLESSMKNGFGLKFIHKFFNLPYLLLQRESLLKQLEVNYLDVESCLEELRFEPDSEAQSFTNFEQMLLDKKSGKKTTTTPAHENKNEPVATTKTSNLPVTAPTNINKDTSLTTTTKTSSNNSKTPAAQTADEPNILPPTNKPEKSGFMSRFFRGKSQLEPLSKSVEPAILTNIQPATTHLDKPDTTVVKNIDEFVPDGGNADQFLDEISTVPKIEQPIKMESESSSDEDNVNPMVSGYQEELDSDDNFQAISNKEPPHNKYTYSDSDEEYTSTTQTSKIKPKTPITSRTKPTSRLSDGPQLEDAQLKQLVIESDNESSGSSIPNIITADKESISSTVPENGVLNIYSNSTNKSEQQGYSEKNDINSHKSNAQLSSDENENYAPALVSNFIEDIPSSEENPDSVVEIKVENNEDKPKTPILQLQSSDFDFLENISSPVTTNVKLQTKSQELNKEGPKTKKHKHKKKKKTKTEGETTSSKSGERSKKKKSSDKQSFKSVDKDLEAFLGGGESYESL